MLAVELDGIEVDHCLHCLGTWLDRGEIEMIALRAGTAASDYELRLNPAKSPKSDDRRCPRCRQVLHQVMIDHAIGLEIDVCPKRHGEWFDQGEILKLVSMCRSGGPRETAAFFGELFQSELETALKKGE
ncbi:MAG: zf-TFIIB domain-containing protein [Planctomycetes bacterium]|nr:zf-TFIIB domain-containing protein [Planctomycetota bacterium]